MVALRDLAALPADAHFYARRGDPHFGPFHILRHVFIGGGFWLLTEAWPVLYAAQRAGQLARTGPYARLRHPQYIGFVLIMQGFLLQWPTLLTLLTLLMFPVLMVMYGRLSLAEERESAMRFGKDWQDYASQVPRFFPGWGREFWPPVLFFLGGVHECSSSILRCQGSSYGPCGAFAR